MFNSGIFWFLVGIIFLIFLRLLIFPKKKQKKLYFMHPVNTYGTELEKDIILFLEESFSGWEIINPNTLEHKLGYNCRKTKTGCGMSYFEELASECNCGVALCFRDGKLGAGVFTEMVTLLKKYHLVWSIMPDKSMTWVRSVHQIEDLKLSIEETKARILDKEGKRIPY